VSDLENLDGKQSEGRNFFARFRIPKEVKKTLRAELKWVGVHEAGLFPELDRISTYVRKEWTFFHEARA
jgi:hypothetical protein